MGLRQTLWTGGWRRPRIQARAALTLLGVFVAVGLTQATLVRVGMVSAGNRTPALLVLSSHLTGALAAWLAFPAVQIAVINAPNPRVGWLRMTAVHVAGYLSFTTVHVLSMAGLRWIAAQFGIEQPIPSRTFHVLWEAQNDVVIYIGLAGLWAVLHAWDDRRTEALRAARLEARLASARLDALTAQLDPHFLFNALNTVSAVMYEDLARTERLLGDLGELLRATLRPGGATWTFAEERRHAERYVAFLEVRFEGRIAVGWWIAAGLERVLVPRFSIQTLVENAVKHNEDLAGPLTVIVRAAEDGAWLSIAVEDDGRGFEDGAAAGRGQGRGLDRLDETLRLLHGGAAQLDRSASAAGGARIALRLPRVEVAVG